MPAHENLQNEERISYLEGQNYALKLLCIAAAEHIDPHGLGLGSKESYELAAKLRHAAQP